MRASFLTIVAAAVGANAAYSGDIVQYWINQAATLVNGTVIISLQSPPSAWIQGIVTGSIYLAAVNSQDQPLDFQQLAVSHAAHNSLAWAFHGTHNLAATDASLKAILAPIGISENSTTYTEAHQIGKKAAAAVATVHADDGFNDFVDYTFGPNIPPVYQATPGGSPIPDTPQARYVRLWAALGDVNQFQVSPPPSISDPSYETDLLYVKAQGEQNSTVRTAYDTDTALFWRESSPVVWNRLANAIIGNTLVKNVTASAKFYAQLNYALTNAGIAAWNIKFKYNTWRPVTAIQYPHIWLPSGDNVFQAGWTPLLVPTPSHQDYVSTHGTFGGAASAVLRAYVGGDTIDATISSNVTLNNRGVITRTFTNLTATAIQNGQSRVFGGIHFPFAAPAAIQLGTEVALATLKAFDANWSKF